MSSLPFVAVSSRKLLDPAFEVLLNLGCLCPGWNADYPAVYDSIKLGIANCTVLKCCKAATWNIHIDYPRYCLE